MIVGGDIVRAGRRLDVGKKFVARAQIGIGQLSRRQAGKGRRIAAAPPRPYQPAQQREQRELKDEPEDRRHAAKFADQAVTEQQAKDTRAEKAGSKPASNPGRLNRPPSEPPG